MPYLHFNSHAHRKNRKDGGDRPTLVYRRTKSSPAILCKAIRFVGEGELIYRPGKPLRCGAVAWIKITGDVEIVKAETPAGACVI